jgi:hypothetical protein
MKLLSTKKIDALDGSSKKNSYSLSEWGTILGVLLILAVPVLNRAITQPQPPSGTPRAANIADTLDHMKHAKEKYAADRSLSKGSLISLCDLLQAGYLEEKDIASTPEGGTYVVGTVGAPVAFTYDEMTSKAVKETAHPSTKIK